jgi:HSP20 family molecular chaperone IbpA
MNTIISRVNTRIEFTHPSTEKYAEPHYDIETDGRAIEISVIVPEVTNDGLEILLYQDQMIVTGRRIRTVRPNWEALRLEHAQPDYRLNINLGFSAHPESVHAELACGILSIRVEQTIAAA